MCAPRASASTSSAARTPGRSGRGRGAAARGRAGAVPRRVCWSPARSCHVAPEVRSAAGVPPHSASALARSAPLTSSTCSGLAVSATALEPRPLPTPFERRYAKKAFARAPREHLRPPHSAGAGLGLRSCAGGRCRARHQVADTKAAALELVTSECGSEGIRCRYGTGVRPANRARCGHCWGGSACRLPRRPARRRVRTRRPTQP
jgi:hypothetical protein